MTHMFLAKCGIIVHNYVSERFLESRKGYLHIVSLEAWSQPLLPTFSVIVYSINRNTPMNIYFLFCSLRSKVWNYLNNLFR